MSKTTWKERMMAARALWLDTLKLDHVYTIEDFRKFCEHLHVGEPEADDPNHRSWGGCAKEIFATPTKNRPFGFMKAGIETAKSAKRNGRKLCRYRFAHIDNPFRPWSLYVIVDNEDFEHIGREIPGFHGCEVFDSHDEAKKWLEERDLDYQYTVKILEIGPRT